MAVYALHDCRKSVDLTSVENKEELDKLDFCGANGSDGRGNKCKHNDRRVSLKNVTDEVDFCGENGNVEMGNECKHNDRKVSLKKVTDKLNNNNSKYSQISFDFSTNGPKRTDAPTVSLPRNDDFVISADDDAFATASPNDSITSIPLSDDEFVNIPDKGICVLSLTHSYIRKYPSISDECYCVISFNRRPSTAEAAVASYERVLALQKLEFDVTRAKMLHFKRAMRYVSCNARKMVDYGIQTSTTFYKGMQTFHTKVFE
ncbi:uncharacterized protein LOC117110590 [Anneissia japonica]|uniref:uncharacterized protein LOC117110590 n=1 Tax=Anneissia japonica TaxID=1529436 RepID=UPI00142550A7|nr:uncharacterized protein LOC117110590 [Anneissia japonica]